MREFYKLIEIIDILRGENGCPWDKKQTRDSLKATFLEEVYETIEALDIGGEELKGELGDVLLHIVFQAKIAKEMNEFDIDDVIKEICDKLIRRHPHIFGDVSVKDDKEVASNWEKIKKEEKINSNRKFILDGISEVLPPLLRAEKIQKKVGAYGFDWDNDEDIFSKIEEELLEVKEAVLEKNKDQIEEEIGDLLFVITNYGRHLGISSSEALRKANKKFIKRFNYIEKNSNIENATLEEMEELWQEAKKNGIK